MLKQIRFSAAAVTLGFAIAVGLSTAGMSTGVAQASPITIFQNPLITGPDIGPAETSEGMFSTIWTTATTGEKPGVTTFAVRDVVPRTLGDGPFSTRFIKVHWRNMESGATGDVDLRYWELLEEPFSHPDYPSASVLPTSAAVDTGTGLVVATVTHYFTQYKAPANPGQLLTGYWAFYVC